MQSDGWREGSSWVSSAVTIFCVLCVISKKEFETHWETVPYIVVKRRESKTKKLYIDEKKKEKVGWRETHTNAIFMRKEWKKYKFLLSGCCKWKIRYTRREFLLKNINRISKIKWNSTAENKKFGREVLCVVFFFVRLKFPRCRLALEWWKYSKFELNEDH